MVNIQVLLALILIRLFIPIGLLIAIGEWEHHREANYRLHSEDIEASILQSSISI
jgi:hypothetical protein